MVGDVVGEGGQFDDAGHVVAAEDVGQLLDERTLDLEIVNSSAQNFDVSRRQQEKSSANKDGALHFEFET